MTDSLIACRNNKEYRKRVRATRITITMADNSTHYKPYKSCKEVSDLCPVELTTLGYYPNVGINIFFAIGFGIALIAVLTTGIWKKTWSYMGFIAAGSVLELAGR